MGNKKISLFQDPNCYADDCNNTGRHLLMFLNSMIFAVKKYWKHWFQVFLL